MSHNASYTVKHEAWHVALLSIAGLAAVTFAVLAFRTLLVRRDHIVTLISGLENMRRNCSARASGSLPRSYSGYVHRSTTGPQPVGGGGGNVPAGNSGESMNQLNESRVARDDYEPAVYQPSGDPHGGDPSLQTPLRQAPDTSSLFTPATRGGAGGAAGADGYLGATPASAATDQRAPAARGGGGGGGGGVGGALEHTPSSITHSLREYSLQHNRVLGGRLNATSTSANFAGAMTSPFAATSSRLVPALSPIPRTTAEETRRSGSVVGFGDGGLIGRGTRSPVNATPPYLAEETAIAHDVYIEDWRSVVCGDRHCLFYAGCVATGLSYGWIELTLALTDIRYSTMGVLIDAITCLPVVLLYVTVTLLLQLLNSWLLHVAHIWVRRLPLIFIGLIVVCLPLAVALNVWVWRPDAKDSLSDVAEYTSSAFAAVLSLCCAGTLLFVVPRECTQMRIAVLTLVLALAAKASFVVPSVEDSVNRTLGADGYMAVWGLLAIGPLILTFVSVHWRMSPRDG